MKKFLMIGVLALAGSAASAADVVDTAASTGQARTLVEAAQSVGLTESLRAPGPFTVFVPTDEAWAQLPVGTVERLLADKALLTEVLKYHVVPGEVSVDKLKPGQMKTAQGQSVIVANGPDGWQVGGAQVIKADVEADNGVVYLIDKVMLPK
jgi:uncharacterized surface protein with fasciclin (FAS1) repeats